MHIYSFIHGVTNDLASNSMDRTSCEAGPIDSQVQITPPSRGLQILAMKLQVLVMSFMLYHRRSRIVGKYLSTFDNVACPLLTSQPRKRTLE